MLLDHCALLPITLREEKYFGFKLIKQVAGFFYELWNLKRFHNQRLIKNSAKKSAVCVPAHKFLRAALTLRFFKKDWTALTHALIPTKLYMALRTFDWDEFENQKKAESQFIYRRHISNVRQQLIPCLYLSSTHLRRFW